MKIRLLLFAGLRDQAGVSELELTGLETGVSVESLLGQLEERWPFLQGYPLAVSRNQTIVARSERLEDGDELALLPPVSGG